MTGFFADAFFSPGVFVESGSSVEAGLTFFLTGLFSGFSEISAVSSLLIGLEAFGRTGFPSASVSLRLFAGFAPAFFSVSFTFSASEPAADLIRQIYGSEGIPLDMTYTGKAFYGMVKYLEENQIQGKQILFLHTGGTPLFFDFLEQEDK